MIFQNIKLGSTLVAASFLSACGGASLSDQVRINLDPIAQRASLEVDMSDGLEVSLDGEFEIAKGYGKLNFVRATKSSNAKIQVSFDLAKLADDQLGGYSAVSSLPNLAPLPVALTPPLVKIPVINQGQIQVEALASIVPELQVGAFIHIAQFKTQYFPQGVAICQNFRNSEGLAFAAVCIFGPGDTKSGGIFVGGSFGDVLNLGDQPSSSELFALSRSQMLTAASRDHHSNTVDQLLAHKVDSLFWDEQRFDPRHDLRGSRGYKAMKNAQKILRSRR
jgi:hypothetical protein